MKNVIIVGFVTLMAIGCSSQKETTKVDPQGQRNGQPSMEEIFKMDANNDGKLSKSEVNGHLQRDFSRFDTNGDGFITKQEFENAPKRQKGQGQRPPKNN